MSVIYMPPALTPSTPSQTCAPKRKRAHQHRRAKRTAKHQASSDSETSMVLCEPGDSMPPPATTIDVLPDELLVRVMDHLPCMERCCGGAASVSRHWRRVALDQKAYSRAACYQGYNRNDPYASAVMLFHTDCIEYGLQRGWLQTADALAEATNRGHFDLAMRLHQRYGCEWEASAMALAAAASGRLDVLKRVCATDARVADLDLCSAAAAAGRLSCLQYAHEEAGCPWGAKTTAAAAAGGHIDCLAYLHRSGCPWDEKATTAAIKGGDFRRGRDNTAGRMACLRYLVANGCGWQEHKITRALVAAGSQWFKVALELGCPFDDDECHNIEMGFTVAHGDTAMVHLLKARGYKWQWHDLDDIIKTDTVEMIDALVAAGAPWDNRMAVRLVRMQQPRLMQWMVGRGLAWNVEECLMEAIISYGEVDRWIIESGCECPRLAKFCLYAAEHGRHEILECMLAHGFPWDPVAGQALLSRCGGPCLGVLLRAGLIGPGPCPQSADMCEAVIRHARDTGDEAISLLYASGHCGDARSTALAAQMGSIKTLRWLVDHGCPVDHIAIKNAALSGHVDCLRYLHQMGYTCDDDVYRLCVEGGSVACVLYLEQIGCRRVPNAALSAVRNNRVDMLRHLHRSGTPLHPVMCVEAAKVGSVACLRYLCGRGFLTDPQACLVAFKSRAYNHTECGLFLDALRRRRAPQCAASPHVSLVPPPKAIA